MAAKAYLALPANVLKTGPDSGRQGGVPPVRVLAAASGAAVPIKAVTASGAKAAAPALASRSQAARSAADALPYGRAGAPCPRCSGNILAKWDEYQCLQCGYRPGSRPATDTGALDAGAELVAAQARPGPAA